MGGGGGRTSTLLYPGKIAAFSGTTFVKLLESSITLTMNLENGNYPERRLQVKTEYFTIQSPLEIETTKECGEII